MDYLYSKVLEVADRLDHDPKPIRRAFAKHLGLVSIALHNIEWVDSADSPPGSEENSIRLVLGDQTKKLILEDLQGQARDLIAQLKKEFYEQNQRTDSL